MINFLFLMCFVLSDHQNIKEYTYSIKCNMLVKSCNNVESILPNGDKVTIPIFNNKVPVIFIRNYDDNKCILNLDYDDKKCVDFKNEKLFSYQVESSLNNHDKSFLETFSTIKKQIDDLKTINNTSMSEIDDVLKNLSKQVKELNAMALDIQNSQNKIMDIQKSQNKSFDSFYKYEKTNEEKNNDNKKGFSELKSLISEVQKELVDIRQKLDAKTEKKKDIIEPNLPIYDKAVIPNIK